MSESSMEKITCPFCHIEHEFKRWRLIDTGTNPELSEQIRSGEIFKYVCPSCKSDYDMNYPFSYHQPDERLFFMYTNNKDDYELARKVMAGEQPSDDDSINELLGRYGYTYRVIFGRDELYEKLLLADRGLDDRIMEIAKIVYGQQLAEKQKEDSFDTIRYFKDDEDDKGVLYLMKDGERRGKVDFDRKVYDWAVEKYGEKIAETAGSDFVVNFYWALKLMQGK